MQLPKEVAMRLAKKNSTILAAVSAGAYLTHSSASCQYFELWRNRLCIDSSCIKTMVLLLSFLRASRHHDIGRRTS